MNAQDFINQLSERGITLRTEGRNIKASPKGGLGSEEKVYLAENFGAVYEAVTGSRFEVEEDEFSFKPPKPIVTPETWLSRVRAHLATKGAYWAYPDCVLGIDAAGNRVKADASTNPRGLPSLIELLERPENLGCTLHVASMFAFSIRGTRKDETDFEFQRWSYDGLPDRTPKVKTNRSGEAGASF